MLKRDPSLIFNQIELFFPQLFHTQKAWEWRNIFALTCLGFIIKTYYFLLLFKVEL